LPKGITLSFQPAREAIEFISKQIKTSGCAYPVFDLARLILNTRDRYGLVFESKGEKKPDGKIVPGPKLYLCGLDSSLWLSRQEAVNHAISCKAFSEYYKEEQVTVDPPKGNFSSIAVCGLSGQLLGPPNHHSYQENIIKVHAERAPRMHIDGYKRKIVMDREEETVEKWKEQQSTQTQYTLLKGEEGAEPVVMKSRQEAARHFTENFADKLIRETQKATVPGNIAGRQLARPLFNLLRQEGDRLRKFPMDLVQRLCRAFEKQGLKFFKEGKKTTYVARLRPRPIPNEANFSDGIRRIVEFVRRKPNTKLNELAGALIPESKRSSPPPPKKQPKKKRPEGKKGKPQTNTDPKLAEQPASKPESEEKKAVQDVDPKTVAPPTAAETPAAETPAADAPASEAAPVAPAQKPEEKPKPPAAPSLTPEEIAVLQDLRWLIREVYVI